MVKKKRERFLLYISDILYSYDSNPRPKFKCMVVEKGLRMVIFRFNRIIYGYILYINADINKGKNLCHFQEIYAKHFQITFKHCQRKIQYKIRIKKILRTAFSTFPSFNVYTYTH